MARSCLEEDQIKKSKGSFAQDSSKTSHVTPDGPVVYDDMVCEWEMGEPEESPVSVMDGDGRGSPILDEEEDGSPEDEVATDLESAERRKMAEDCAVVGGSTKDKEDEKKVSPKKKRRGRSRRQAPRAAEMTSGWNITMETLLKYIPNVMLLLFVFTIFLPNTECSVVAVGDVKPNLTCYAYTYDQTDRIISKDSDSEIWNKKMETGSCDDGIQAGVPCHRDGRIICMERREPDFEGKGMRLNSSKTECPPSRKHPQHNQPSSDPKTGITDPPAGITNPPSSDSPAKNNGFVGGIFLVFLVVWLGICIFLQSKIEDTDRGYRQTPPTVIEEEEIPNRNQESLEDVQVPLQLTPVPAETLTQAEES